MLLVDDYRFSGSLGPVFVALRRLVLLVLLVAVSWFAWGERRPSIDHVIMISIDTLRADFLGSYGHPYVQTPFLDDLAERGVVFEKQMAAAPTTLASHTSMMTGLWPHTHGVPRNGFLVPAEHEMLAEILQK